MPDEKLRRYRSLTFDENEKITNFTLFSCYFLNRFFIFVCRIHFKHKNWFQTDLIKLEKVKPKNFCFMQKILVEIVL